MPISIGLIADICGIISFVFSVVIWLATKNLKEQINVYRRAQKNITTNLMANKDSIIRDGLYNGDIRSNLRIELYAMLQSYGSLLSFPVKCRIRWAIHLLKQGSIDSMQTERLCALIDYIIARFQKKEMR